MLLPCPGHRLWSDPLFSFDFFTQLLFELLVARKQRLLISDNQHSLSAQCISFAHSFQSKPPFLSKSTLLGFFRQRCFVELAAVWRQRLLIADNHRNLSAQCTALGHSFQSKLPFLPESILLDGVLHATVFFLNLRLCSSAVADWRQSAQTAVSFQIHSLDGFLHTMIFRNLWLCQNFHY